jgi:Zn-dependent membrane protease YugP
MFYFDTTYLLYIFLPILVLSLGVQLYLKSTFSKWSQVRNSSGLNGMQAGQELFRRTDLDEIPLQPTRGSLTDNFDPRHQVVNLSEPVATKQSVAAMAVVAHELGHVQQYQKKSALMGARNFLVPAVQFSPMISYVAIIAGIIFNSAGLLWLGVIFFGLLVFFSILTVPVEIDASRRGIAMLRQAGLIQTDDDAKGSKAVLTAAAMTYLAAAVGAVLQLLYFIMMARNN